METIESLKAELADAHRATHATDISLQNVIAELDGLKAQQSPDYAALRKWYVKLTNADNVQDGINVNGKHCTAEMMDEFESILGQQSPAVAVPDSDYIAGVLESAVELYTHRWSDEFCDVSIGIMKKGMGFIYPEGLIEFAKQIRAGEFELPQAMRFQSPQRVTEQDAAAIYESAVEHYKYTQSFNRLAWLHMSGRALLAKLNGVGE